MESFKKSSKTGLEHLRKEAYGRTMAGLAEDYTEGGLQAVAVHTLEAARIYPNYTAAKNPEIFYDMRTRLQHEPGLIIANHPGHYDTFLIFNVLERDDVKVVVSEDNYEMLARHIDSDKFIKATTDPHEALSFLKAIKDHVASGGVVILYPTGGRERITGAIEFKPGFAAILQRCVSPDDMVYSFYIDRDDMAAAKAELGRTLGASSAILTNDLIVPNDTREILTISVDESYSLARQWQEVATNATQGDRDNALTNYFIKTHKN